MHKILATVLYAVWRELNKVRHGDKLLSLEVVKRMIEKGIRNKISVMRLKGSKRDRGADTILVYY